MPYSPGLFAEQLADLSNRVRQHDGQDFERFTKGIVHEWEGYKPRVFKAGRQLIARAVQEHKIGSGFILNAAIEAIENPLKQPKPNNLVELGQRYGAASASHVKFLQARDDPQARRRAEQWLADAFTKKIEGRAAMDALIAIVGKRYDLVSYLFFLIDMNRFMPVKTSFFDLAFKRLGITLQTSGRCGWDNYASFNNALEDIRSDLERVGGFAGVRLIDAHSFCWLLVNLKGDAAPKAVTREACIDAMLLNTVRTTRYARGQSVRRLVKEKTSDLSPPELRNLIERLLGKQKDRCALTGIAFPFGSGSSDPNLLPSLDRKNSAGHYTSDNLQVVCRFANFWKSDMPDDEFKRLLSIARSARAPR